MKWVFTTLLFIAFFSGCKAQPDGEGGAIPVHYQEFGSGTPLLIINGGPGMNSDGFASLAKLMSKKYRAVIFDQRGTGKSLLQQTNSSSITMNLMVEDMEALRKKLGIDSWIVLGHSFGGMLASYYAVKYPASVSALILSSSGGIDLGFMQYISSRINEQMTKEEQETYQRWNNKISQGDTTRQARYERAKALASAYLSKKEFIPVIAERLLQGNMTINQLVFADMQKINFNCLDGLRSFKKPVLIIQGRQDIIKEETAQKTKEALPQAGLIFLDNCGHYGWIEQETLYTSSIFNFLRRNNKI